jgi:hypothetical protein
MALSPAEKLLLRKVSSTNGSGDTKFTAWGSKGTLQFLGFDIDASDSLATSGISKTVSRPATRKARWLGDTTKTRPSGGGDSNIAYYPSKRGSALPGTPVKIVNLDVVQGPNNTNPRYTIQIQGRIDAFIQYLIANPLPFNAKLIGKSGNPYKGILAKAV